MQLTSKIGGTLIHHTSIALRDTRLLPSRQITCSSCQGTGEWVQWGCQCPRCEGRGFVIRRQA